MGGLLQDPDLNRLVQSLNRDARPGHRDDDAPFAVVPRLPGQLAGSGRLAELLRTMALERASDLLLVPGEPPVLRVDGALSRLPAAVLTPEDVATCFAPALSSRHRRKLEETGAADFSLEILPEGELAGPGALPWRFRVNLHRQRGELAAAVRALPRKVPTLAGLNLPAELASLADAGSGLVLVTGPTGAGKTSTLAALVGEINRQRACHVLTIEDPIEYEHHDGRALIEHVEVGRDAPGFAEALRAALRQDPDVLLVGEMRDLDTIRTALTAAETGHLVLSTLHTASALGAIHRIVDVFPADQQDQVRLQLAQSLRAVLSQQLVPRKDAAGRVPAIELLRATYSVRHLIRRRHDERLYNEMTLGSKKGMLTLEASLARLVAEGLIDEDEARLRANHPDEL